ncbi:MAG: hypothetical protein H6722_10115 [Sandaracinus sp.]|nr:hypothetical protein [Sandaracinus sp.]
MNHRSSISLSALLCTLLFVGCGSSTPSVEESAALFCEGDSARAERCGDGAFGPDDLAECEAEMTVFFRSAREDAHDAITDCNSSRACDESDDRCFSAAGLGLTPSSTATEYQTACLAYRETCDGMGEGIIDDYCYADIFDDSVLAEMRSCLSGACSDFHDCVETAAGF